ncbi:MAG: ClpXP protease specificity-enhancing factor SspB [Rickettsiales bacterium]|jgi:hypothetical protein|nr:ClpXP protease specificity-enhancing factor SspB [Rickettsiales bacterium]
MKSEFPELNYDKLVDNAFIGVVRDALKHVEKYGLPSNHFFYITIKTKFRGVKLPEFLLQKYPDNMTIILQYEFSNLHVSDKEFGVTLSFNTQNYYIRIPFKSIIAFTDPGVNFSLQFNVPDIYGDDFLYDDDYDEPSLPLSEMWEESGDLIKIYPNKGHENQISESANTDEKKSITEDKSANENDEEKIISIDKFRK